MVLMTIKLAYKRTFIVSINLKKSVIDLQKSAKVVLEKQQLSGVKSQVVLVLDISKSMNPLFKNGVIQELVERILGLALNFDDDGQIDIILFGTNAYQLPSASIDNIENYVNNEIVSKYKIIEATKYATALNIIKDKYQGNKADPVFVIFITDGNNTDKTETTNLIIDLSKESIFFQFVAIGGEKFPYLNKLDDLPNRFIDNAGFVHINELATIDDASLYNGLLNEYPSWLKEAAQKGMLNH